MQITAVNDRRDLFQVTDILSNELLDLLSKEILESIPFTEQEWQEDWKRRRLTPMPGSTLESIDKYINLQKDTIGKGVGLNITQIDTRFWLDLPGFDCPVHLDNEGVDYVMQLFLSDAPYNLGTVFYDNKNVRKAFEFKLNTGYIMFNNNKQLHGMTNVVSKSVQRFTSYSYFQTRNLKNL